MNPQPPPTVSPASHSYQQQQYDQQRSHESSPNDPNDEYSEKDAYQRNQNQNLRLNPGNGRSHDSVISHPFSPKASSPPSPSSSISAARHDRSAPEIQQSPPANVSYPPKAHIDPEKQAFSPQSPRSPARVSSSNPDVTAILYDSGEYNEKGPEDKAVQLLLYLSGPCAILSLIITLWTFVSLLFIAILLSPFRLFTKRTPLGSQITTFLAPPLNLQLHLIYSYSSSTDYSPPLLVVIHLFSPIVAMGVAVAAWTAAFFWFFSAILGDPAGQDGHNDGRDSILGVRNWWDRWLSRALRLHPDPL
ncbi:hypothetical protein K469DRAFT_558844 [Zopfia rhizophila CBS 207.26]|uniref:Uncharacterized protein n=1 Tax=Zopfia rhizophila CBS 207.26 TaxID=1314779 RepID=A0A6A6EL98_9PEZI|nr:hypothetical protein K469DRAFT_558844 [Zopfia rhizophila CBS 207.26]